MLLAGARTSVAGDSGFNFNPATQEWVFHLDGAGLASGSTYVYVISLNDGTTIQFQFGIK
jgi:hypothetical protein